jgi:uncharacterized protein YxeA
MQGFFYLENEMHPQTKELLGIYAIIMLIIGTIAYSQASKADWNNGYQPYDYQQQMEQARRQREDYEQQQYQQRQQYQQQNYQQQETNRQMETNRQLQMLNSRFNY